MPAQIRVARRESGPPFGAEAADDQAADALGGTDWRSHDPKAAIPDHGRAGCDRNLLGRHFRLAADEKGTATRDD